MFSRRGMYPYMVMVFFRRGMYPNMVMVLKAKYGHHVKYFLSIGDNIYDKYKDSWNLYVIILLR